MCCPTRGQFLTSFVGFAELLRFQFSPSRINASVEGIRPLAFLLRYLGRYNFQPRFRTLLDLIEYATHRRSQTHHINAVNVVQFVQTIESTLHGGQHSLPVTFALVVKSGCDEYHALEDGLGVSAFPEPDLLKCLMAVPESAGVEQRYTILNDLTIGRRGMAQCVFSRPNVRQP